MLACTDNCQQRTGWNQFFPSLMWVPGFKFIVRLLEAHSSAELPHRPSRIETEVSSQQVLLSKPFGDRHKIKLCLKKKRKDTLRRQRQGALCEFEASLDYRVSPGQAPNLHREPPPKKQNKTK